MKNIRLVLLGLAISCKLSACVPSENTEDKIQAYIEKADNYYENEDYEQSIYSLEQAMDLSVEEYGEKSKETADIYLKLAMASTSLSQAEDYAQAAEQIYQVLSDDGGLAKVFFTYGVVYSRGYQKADAEKAYKEALRYCEMSSENMSEVKFHTYLRLIGLNIGSEEEALAFGKETEKLLKELPESVKVSYELIVYSNIGNSYYNLKHYDQAIEYYEKAIINWNQNLIGDMLTIAELFDHCGYSYAVLEHYNKAIEYINHSLDLLKNIDEASAWNFAIAYRHLSTIYAVDEIKDYEMSAEYGLKSCQAYLKQTELDSKELEEFLMFKNEFQRLYEQTPLEETKDFESWFEEQISNSK